MSTQEVSTEELVRMVIEEPNIKLESSFDKLTIAVQTEKTKRKVRLALKGKEVEVLYNNDEQITPGMIQDELTKHSSLLELARSLRTEENGLAAQAVNREIDIQRTLQFVSPQIQAIIKKTAKVIAGIFMLLNLESPFVQKTVNNSIRDEMTTLAILKRCIMEISKQRKIYESLQTKKADQKLDELVRVMGELIHTLNGVARSMKNSLLANSRAFGTRES